MKTKFLVLCLLVAVIANSSTVLGADADADAVTVPHFEVSCASGIQLCEPPFSVSVTTTLVKKAIQLKYDILTNRHCSSIRLHIFVDGKLVKTTDFLGWTGAEAPFNTLPLTTNNLTLPHVKPGIHVVSINAEGQSSGCNSGTLSAWGGSLQFSVVSH